MLGQHAEAEEHFAAALALFDSDPGLTDEARKAEKDHTAVYRAINALDLGLTDALDRLNDVLGPLESAADELGQMKTREYHHHLLLRTCWQRGDMAAVWEAYLRQRAKWPRCPQHPWMTIDMYRGLLLWNEGDDEAQAYFERAVDGVAAIPHGAILDLIAAMFATVAACCFSGGDWGARAEALLVGVEAAIPDTAAAVAELRSVLADPVPERINEALGVLPFNYH